MDNNQVINSVAGGNSIINQSANSPQFHEMYPGDTAPQGIPVNYVIGKEPILAYCYICKEYNTTLIEKKPGQRLWCCFCILLISFAPLAPIPFCCPSCYDVVHTCPKCTQHVAKNWST